MTDGIEIETIAGPDGPRLTKRATTAPARSRLSREIDRLHRARHPGVVEVIEHSDGHIVFAWAGGQTLATFRPPTTVAAAVLATTATTVADLHDLRIVHGRLDPSHVVIGADGRPRLCGMAGLDPSARSSTEADDVAALGQLIEGLIGAETEEEPIPERRWNRRRLGGFQRRALQTLADQAAAHDPALRPTARALATAIAEAVPEARLQVSEVKDRNPSAIGAVARVTHTSGESRRHRPSQPVGRHLRQRPRRPVPIVAVALSLALALALALAATIGADLASTVPKQPTNEPACAAVTNASPQTKGCPQPYGRSGTSLHLDGQTYTVGGPGDRVAVGDWDCNGTMTPGLVRPSTGEVFLFRTWSGAGSGMTIGPTAIVGGATSLQARPAGTACAPPLVQLSDGTIRALPVGGAR